MLGNVRYLQNQVKPPPQLFITDCSKAVLLLWFKFIQVIHIMSFMLDDFVATRISIGCSLSPQQFASAVHASTVTTLPSAYVTCLNLCMICAKHDCFLISCLYLCIIVSLQKQRTRFGTCKTSLSPPVILYY